MKKLRLSLDALTVDSFETYPVPRFEGTVHARAEGTDASNCATCETCQGPHCCACRDSTLV
ncbi:MAG TPA: hypothetical protein VFR81_28215 [Longimicrobium sp.]|nr:hypothetical protein [Longimicrobium sp.]